MDNIDLLEMAAKSIGIETHGAMRADWLNGHSTYWNPLTDDGDALRLANNLDVSILFGGCADGAPIVTARWVAGEVTLPNFPDANAATRRAIVRAAASIGEQMK